MDAKVIYLDGRFQTPDVDLQTALTPGIVDKDGVFETMRVDGQGKIICLDAHLRRLKRGLRFYRLPVVVKADQLQELIRELLSQNRMKEAGVRLSVWRENKKTRVALVARKLGKIVSTDIKVVVAQQRFVKNRASGLKSLHYSFYRKAFEEARRQNADEALLLSARGEVVEGSRSNVFIVSGGKILTSPVRLGCLDGIARKKVIQLAKKLGIPCREGAFGVNKLLSAEEVFLTNALRGIIPVKVVGSQRIGSGKIGRVTRQLRKFYQ